MNKYHPQFIKSIEYMLAKLKPESTNFTYKLSEISALCIMPIIDVYEMAENYFSIDLSEKIQKIKAFYE